MSIDLEYAIKQDIRNNPVVREVDRDQKREFVRTLGWAALVVGMLMFALWPRTNLLASRLPARDAPRRAGREEHAYQRQYRLELEMLPAPAGSADARDARAAAWSSPTNATPSCSNACRPASPAVRAIVAAVR